MCACRCGIRVHLRDGEVRYIDGNPEHPLNKGVICAKGASGIMKQYSPARLTQPLRRKAGSERGARRVRADLVGRGVRRSLAERLAKIRATDPKKFALFTGRDQMQALTGLFARQFGTPNYAAHGGFCSVNMAAGMIYTIGGSFWEFGGPDLDRAQALRDDRHRGGPSLQSAEDRDLEVQAQRRPLHLDQPDPHRLLGDRRRMDADPSRHRRRAAARADPRADRARASTTASSSRATPTPGSWSNSTREASDDFGLHGARRPRAEVNPHVSAQQAVVGPAQRRAGRQPHAGRRPAALRRATRCPTARRSSPRSSCSRSACATARPSGRREITGIPAATIRRLAHEMGVTARDQKIELPIAVDRLAGASSTRRSTGNPVAFHAMRGLAAHSNGFQTIRALAILMSLLGTIDRPGGFRHKAPFPRAIPPIAKPPNGAGRGQAEHAARRRSPLGWPASPDDLFVDDDGEPVRIDKALLVGVPAVGARADAQRDHQRLARRPVPHRHAA